MEYDNPADRKTFIVGLLIFALFGYIFWGRSLGAPTREPTREPTPTPTAVPLDVSMSDEMVVIQHRGSSSLRVVMKINGKWEMDDVRLKPGENVFYTREFTDREGYRFNALTTRLEKLSILDYDGRWGYSYTPRR